MGGEWITLDRNALNPAQRIRLNDVEFEGRLSPYDVPTHLRFIMMEGEPKRLAIDFRYLDEESVREQLLEDGSIVKLGRRSERLFGLVVTIPSNAEKGKLRLVIQGVAGRLPKPGDQRHEQIINSSRMAAQNAIDQSVSLSSVFAY